MAVHHNYINGTWAEAGEPASNINPSNVADIVGEYERANEPQVRAAIAAARAALISRVAALRSVGVSSQCGSRSTDTVVPFKSGLLT